MAGDVTEYLPCPQEMQVVSELAARVVEYVPSAQSRQTVCEFAARALEYFPCAHCRQLVEPGNSENFPALQFSQVEIDVAPYS